MNEDFSHIIWYGSVDLDLAAFCLLTPCSSFDGSLGDRGKLALMTFISRSISLLHLLFGEIKLC